MLFFLAVITLFLIAVIYFDVTSYIIPNWISGILLGLYPFLFFMGGVFPEDFNVWISLGVFAATFVVGIIIFAMNWAGGGDVKLLAVLGLWAGKEAIIPFVFYTGLIGGIMSLLLLMARPLAGRFNKTNNPEDLPRVLRHREPLPYGIAITLGFLIVLWMGDIPGLPVKW